MINEKEILKTLLENKSDSNIQNRERESSFQLILKNKLVNIEILSLFLQNNAKINSNDPHLNPIYIFLNKNHNDCKSPNKKLFNFEIFKFLFENKADLNQIDKLNKNLLHVSLSQPILNFHIIRLLVTDSSLYQQFHNKDKSGKKKKKKCEN